MQPAVQELWSVVLECCASYTQLEIMPAWMILALQEYFNQGSSFPTWNATLSLRSRLVGRCLHKLQEIIDGVSGSWVGHVRPTLTTMWALGGCCDDVSTYSPEQVRLQSSHLFHRFTEPLTHGQPSKACGCGEPRPHKEISLLMGDPLSTKKLIGYWPTATVIRVKSIAMAKK
jgi:hypothetical protein